MTDSWLRRSQAEIVAEIKAVMVRAFADWREQQAALWGVRPGSLSDINGFLEYKLPGALAAVPLTPFDMAHEYALLLDRLREYQGDRDALVAVLDRHVGPLVKRGTT